MDKILVAGIDTIAGANIAAWLSGRHPVLGLSWRDPVSIAGCETAVCDGTSPDAARHWMQQSAAKWVIFCGSAAESSWQPEATALTRAKCCTEVEWAAAARQAGAEFTLLSSDRVFTGPWMFHRESSTCHCESPAAQAILRLEEEVTTACPDALIVRTNAFGWGPKAKLSGMIEATLTALREEQPFALDCQRHGSPILATDLAEILEQAWKAKLRGLFHIGGGERINPFRFACLLADEFNLPAWTLEAVESGDRRREFGAGEASLQSRKIRKVLEMPLPLIREGLARLREQHEGGFREKFGVASAPRVAARAA